MPAADYCDFSGMRSRDCHHCKTGARTLAPVTVTADDDDEVIGIPPGSPTAGPGPWFAANYPGHCSAGGHDTDRGDQIRADGSGGYECKECA